MGMKFIKQKRVIRFRRKRWKNYKDKKTSLGVESTAEFSKILYENSNLSFYGR